MSQELGNISSKNLSSEQEQSPVLDTVEEVILPNLLETKPAEYESNKLKVQNEGEHIFIPSSMPVFHRCKLPNNMIPRVIEDEGLFVQRKPELYRKTINKMENRLIKENRGKQWFELSGEIISLASPIKQTWHARKDFSVAVFHPALETVYKKAMKSEQESSIISKIGGQAEWYQLDLNILSLMFTHHPLFSREHVLAAKLSQLYEQFQCRQQQNITHLLSEKLKALTDAAKIFEHDLEVNNLQNNKTLEDYRWQIRNTKTMYDVEQRKDSSLIRNMLKVWKQIKSLRIQQGYSNTPVKLQFYKLVKVNEHEEEEYKKEVTAKLTDSAKELREDSYENIEPFDSVLVNWKKKEENQYSLSTGMLDKQEMKGTVREQSHMQQRYPVFIPWLTMTAEVSPLHKCPLHEKMRKIKVEKLKYFIKMFYNGKLAFSTMESPLQLDFKIEFQQVFSLQILNWPESICLEIYETANKKKSLLAKLYLPIPNSSWLSGKDALEQAEFSSDKVVVPAEGEVGSNVSFLSNENGTKEVYLLTSGKLMYSLSWATDENGISLAPAVSQSKRFCNRLVLEVQSQHFSHRLVLEEQNQHFSHIPAHSSKFYLYRSKVLRYNTTTKKYKTTITIIIVVSPDMKKFFHLPKALSYHPVQDESIPEFSASSLARVVSPSSALFMLSSGAVLLGMKVQQLPPSMMQTPPSFANIISRASALKSVNTIMPSPSSWFRSSKKFEEWAKEIRIDPNDPQYSDLVQYDMYARIKDQAVSEHFRFEQMQEEFNFLTEEEIAKSKRFQLLVLRNSEPSEFCHFQQIPLYDKEIPDSVFQEYEQQMEKDTPLVDYRSIIAQRITAGNFMSKLRSLVLKKLLKIKCKNRLPDFVNEYEEVTSLSQLSLAIFKITELRRHLKPQRKERKKIPARILMDGDVKILVRISRAYNIPVRKSENSRSNVCPFIEVSFQDTTYQTSMAHGSHPCWNEELQMDFKSPGGDYTYAGLTKIKDKIYINIFDEAVIEKHEDNCLRGCSTHSYTKKNWLGSVAFPFTALLHQSKVSGTFQVNTPPVLLGYTWNETYMVPNEENSDQDRMENSLLTIFTTIEPYILAVGRDLEKFINDEKLLQIAYSFKKYCKGIFPQRRIITTVFDTEGKSVFVTRYIMKLNPPEELLAAYADDLEPSFDLVPRFVSLIPCFSDIMDLDDSYDACQCWMTSEQFITWGVGSKEEHAVLLCNYFLYLGKKAWVLLGTSVLEGPVSYVVTLENVEYFLWNPMNGHCYKQFDIFCPLRSVDCLINEENIWFNTQHNNSPMSVNFDTSKETVWKPLLTKTLQCIKQPTIQPEKINYLPTNKSMVQELEKRIERSLKNKIMEWRAKHPTRWNRQWSTIFKKSLSNLELNYSSTLSKKDLKDLFREYRVSGFPLQLPYSDLQTITDAVYRTGVHTTEIPNTEFALTVYIHPYPNNILSVWIYIASLVRYH
ncbi:LOW QUALITY PROTEIN: protein CC2D2B [Microcaecilia unicolor]|uniref:LOW QUALITY PROTEIN: protein CC2D2B n=1 Tax=Microcaecilia unicolor TaxID=1415580 RepID=A0A6P7Y772_9AMPH|nr:LOW QUALITY PROTEIN: protein CC2D2B [Microcaecilia unicolor]